MSIDFGQNCIKIYTNCILYSLHKHYINKNIKKPSDNIFDGLILEVMDQVLRTSSEGGRSSLEDFEISVKDETKPAIA